LIAFRAAERRRTCRVAVLFAALTALLAFPLSVRPADHVMSASPDTNLFLWTLAWDVHAFTHQPLRIFEANIYYPLRHTLAYSENLIGSAVIAAPILWITANPVLAMNLVALLSAALCGVGGYALARQVGVGPGAAVISGVVFAFSPPRFLRLDQLHLATIQWVPFGLASLHAYLDEGRRVDLRMAAALFTLQALSSGHGVVFLTLAMTALIAFRLATGDRMAIARRLRDLGVAGALLLAPALLAFVPYTIVQREAGLRRTLENWTVSSSSFLASPSHAHQWVLSLFPSARINETADAYLFPGCVPIVLALCAITIRRASAGARRDGGTSGVDRRAIGFYALLTLVSVWLTLGPPIGLWPLVYWLPGLNFIRVPSRFMLLAILGLAVLSGFGVETLARVLRPTPHEDNAGHEGTKARRTRSTKNILRVFVPSWPAFDERVSLACGVLLVLEFASFPLGLDAYRPEMPPIDRWLATQPAPFVVAEVPLPSPGDLGAWERRHTAFMLHSTAHWQKTVHGYSGLRLPLHVELYDELTRFPDEQSVASLARLGVTYVVMHTDWYRAGDRAEIDGRMDRFRDRLRLEHSEGEGRVYAVVSASTRRESR
jgi:hypothetical protein